MRRTAAEALGFIGPDAKGATAALKAATGDEDPAVAEAATQALKMIEAKPPTDK